jgi:hypothetical protein
MRFQTCSPLHKGETVDGALCSDYLIRTQLAIFSPEAISYYIIVYAARLLPRNSALDGYVGQFAKSVARLQHNKPLMNRE